MRIRRIVPYPKVMETYGEIISVSPGSPAEAAGLRPGDRLKSINGEGVRDVIDYRFLAAEAEVELVFLRDGKQRRVFIEKDIDEPLGLEFAEELFNGVRTCDNCCIFCFVHQLPKGMRKSLYVRDDDFRLSFLHGNFITLTSETDEDIHRIIRQRLSPLYISVHASDEELRRAMLGNPAAPEIMARLEALAAAGIALHTQIVLCPGINDGAHLDRTIGDLAGLYPGVQSIAVVPVGLTRYSKSTRDRLQEPALRPILENGARRALDQVRRWQKTLLQRIGRRLVYASDEIYLAAGERVPSAKSYEGFPQLENGVGIVRQFLDRAARAARKLPQHTNRPLHMTLVTGLLAAPIISRFAAMVNRIEGLKASVQAIKNDFFGEFVTVAGLLTGRDILGQLRGRRECDLVVLPSVCLRDDLFLDDIRVRDLQAELRIPVDVISPDPIALADRVAVLADAQK